MVNHSYSSINATPTHAPVQIKRLTTKGYKNVKKREKTVARAYGGTLCGKAVRER